jgi:DNA-binding CsgD family transcriptional regulator
MPRFTIGTMAFTVTTHPDSPSRTIVMWGPTPARRGSADVTRAPTNRELEILAAWWWSKGSNIRAAMALDRHPQTVKNTLMRMRQVYDARSNIELVQDFMDEVGERRYVIERRVA